MAMGRHRDKRSIIRGSVRNNSVFGSAFLHPILDAGPGECLGDFLEVFLAVSHAIFDERIEITRFSRKKVGRCPDDRHKGYWYSQGSRQSTSVWQSLFRVSRSV